MSCKRVYQKLFEKKAGRNSLEREKKPSASQKPFSLIYFRVRREKNRERVFLVRFHCEERGCPLVCRGIFWGVVPQNASLFESWGSPDFLIGEGSYLQSIGEVRNGSTT
ncbi:conserved hypothetical protein [Chlamydia trachomatis F/SW5]|nr:conserved hypothetical protein [Chlamydia trachomatis F/SW5]